MKSKVLSLVLALTVLCGIMVPTVSFAAPPAGVTANEVQLSNFSVGDSNNEGKVEATKTEVDGRTDVAGIKVTTTDKIAVDAGYGYAWPGYTLATDFSNSFTLEFEFKAVSGTWLKFASGDSNLIVNDTGLVFFTSANKKATNTANLGEWNHVLFYYDVNSNTCAYYLNNVILTNSEIGSEFTPNKKGNYVFGLYPTQAAPTTDEPCLYIDNVYMYAGAYTPDGTQILPKSPEIKINHDSENKKRDAVVTLPQEYVGCKLFIACYNKNNELIGVASKEIVEAGENIVTRDQSTVLNDKSETEYVLTNSLKAFVWTANNQPTGIITTLP